MTIIDICSDLHGHYPKLDGGDLLIVAGDLTAHDDPREYVEFGLWLNQQKYKRKIFVGGNHDCLLEITPEIYKNYPDSIFTYLCDSGTEFDGLKIYGSPWTKTFEGMNEHCKAFTVDTEEELAEKWKLIPDDVDILVTHSPAWGTLDGQDPETKYGSQSLLRKILDNGVNKLKLHVCGHIHEGYGIWDIRKLQDRFDDIHTPVFVNASHVNERYEPVNKPIRVVL